VAVLVILLVVAALVAGAIWSYLAKQRRRDELAKFAAAHKLTYSPQDGFGLDGLPFHLFSMGDGRGCENVLSGTWEGVPVRAADYWYYTESTDSEGHRSKTYHRFSIVLAGLDGWLPAVRIEHENVLTRLGGHVGLGDIEFESEQFNRKFRVLSKDREFAFKLVDARMMQWLLATAGDHCYEVSGDHLLAYGDKLAPAELGPRFFAAKGFVNQVPRLVWNEYGTDKGKEVAG
jgi:hypothetical protein